MLIIWDIANGECLHTLTEHTRRVSHVAITLDGRIAISASYDKTLIVWDIKSGERLHTLIGHEKEVKHVAITPDGTTAVSSSHDKMLIVWDIASGRQMMRVEDTIAGRQNIAAVHPQVTTFDGFMRLTDGTQLIDYHGQLLMQTLDGSATPFIGDADIRSAEMLDGRIVVAGDNAGRVLFLRWHAGEG